MKILVAGVPFGRDNVGDEAILETVISLLRRCTPHAELTISTDDGPATQKKFQVRTVELFGFAPPYTEARLQEEIENHDVFFWAGATGLSDYPEIPTAMMRVAQQAGKKTVVWNVGMNDELNPAKYRLTSGKKKMLLDLASRLTAGRWNGVKAWEQRAESRARACIKQALDAADLVVVRDEPSREQVLLCDVTTKVITGADTALLLEPDNNTRFNPEVQKLIDSSKPLFGLCISAQREIAGLDRMVTLLNRVVTELDAGILFIPMNPVTDAKLMTDLSERMAPETRSHTAVLTGRREPAEVLTLSQHLTLVASSRLHLLILSSIFHIPLVGISRGSKVDNFLAPFGLTAVGTVEQCNFEIFFSEIQAWVKGTHSEEFRDTSERVRKEMLKRLSRAESLLKKVLTQ